VDPLARVAERKLAEAISAGELDDFAGKGEPLPPEEDLAHVPEDLRAGYRLLRGHGFLPEELEARRGLAELDLLLAACDPAERADLNTQRRTLALKLALLVERSGMPATAIEDWLRSRS
jgi:hypothetical protein